MKVIDWRSWLRDPFAEQKPREMQQDDLIWRDPITQVAFAIHKNDYEQLQQSAVYQLSSLSAPEAYEHLTKTPYPFGSNDDLLQEQIAFHIPFPRPLSFHEASKLTEKGTRCRLVDFVLLRTGLYFALFSNGQMSEEWQSLRQQLLQPEPPLSDTTQQQQVAAIDHYLTSGEVHDDWQDRTLSVVKAGAVKIKQYFLETNKIQEIRGASRLLEAITRDDIPAYLSKAATPESVVYSGGGNILIVVPERLGIEVAHKIETLYSHITVSAQAIAYPATVRWADLDLQDFASTFAWIEFKKAERQMTKGIQEPSSRRDLNVEVSPALEEIRKKYKSISTTQYIESLKKSGQDTASLLIGGRTPICQSCRLRDAVHFYKRMEEHEAKCSSCYQKTLNGNDEAEQKFLNEIKQIASQYDPSLQQRQLQVAEHLEDIAESTGQKMIAVVYGDGNNMGAVVEKLDSFTKYRYFSTLTDQITKLATYTTLAELATTDEKKVPLFEVIAVGGDDVFMVLPASCGLEAAWEIGNKFDQAFSTYQEKEKEGLTISFGISIASYHMPFATLYQTAVELLKSAKEAKKRKKGEWRGGSVDFMVLSNSTPYAESLQEHRNSHYYKKAQDRKGNTVQLRYLMRPYTFEQAEKVADWVLTLKDVEASRGVLYHLRNVHHELTIDEARHYYHFYMLSNPGKYGQRKEVHLSFGKHVPDGMKQDFLFYKREGRDGAPTELTSPLHDLVELWPVYEGGRTR